MRVLTTKRIERFRPHVQIPPRLRPRTRMPAIVQGSLLTTVFVLSLTSVARADLVSAFRQMVSPPSQTPHPAVVQVISPEHDSIAQGSGSYITADAASGYVLTNWHVVRDANEALKVKFPDGFESPAQVVKTDQTWDLALLRIQRAAVAPVPMAQTNPQLGEPLIIAGYGSGPYRAARGVCSHYAAPDAQQPMEMFEVSIAARQGDSGGPIVNARGELAGVLFGAGSGMTTGTSVERVRQFLDDTFLSSKNRQPWPSSELIIAQLPKTTDSVPLPARIASASPRARITSIRVPEETPPPSFPVTPRPQEPPITVASTAPIDSFGHDPLDPAVIPPLTADEIPEAPFAQSGIRQSYAPTPIVPSPDVPTVDRTFGIPDSPAFDYEPASTATPLPGQQVTLNELARGDAFQQTKKFVMALGGFALALHLIRALAVPRV